MASKGAAIKRVFQLGMPFQTPDPFLFCVYHLDAYPAGNEAMQAPRRGDGADFNPDAPYRMYHGDRVPGFPQHPHRGFETITAVLEGNCDHSDSLGNSGRFSTDDLQFMTAGKGVVHGENFPLVHRDRPNTLRLFQIWLNLEREKKMSEPDYQMQWAETLTKVQGAGGSVARVFVGRLGDLGRSVAPPKASWASNPANDVGVFYITLPAGGSSFSVPGALEGRGINRSLYIVGGKNVSVDGRRFAGTAGMDLSGEAPITLSNGDPATDAEVLILQGRPIGEPVAQRGPFVMNTDAEIAEAFATYRRTQFGGWPWKEDAVFFPRDAGRFSTKRGPDGKDVTERPAEIAEIAAAAAAAAAAGGAGEASIGPGGA